ncbi:MAG: hypothetical protein ABSB54_18985, partial [Acidimicrobiales bacterium]
KRAHVAVMDALNLSSTITSDLTIIRDGSTSWGHAVSRTVGPSGVGRWNFTSNDAVTNGTGVRPGSIQPRLAVRG